MLLELFFFTSSRISWNNPVTCKKFAVEQQILSYEVVIGGRLIWQGYYEMDPYILVLPVGLLAYLFFFFWHRSKICISNFFKSQGHSSTNNFSPEERKSHVGLGSSLKGASSSTYRLFSNFRNKIQGNLLDVRIESILIN